MNRTSIKKPASLLYALCIVGLLCCACAAYGADAKTAAPAKASATLDCLMKSFNGESNANARYLAFAKKADEEGYGQVASLFRAAAAAEEIHFTAQAKVIKELGGEPKADIKAPEVKSTKENLAAAVKGESYERDTMYPDFIKVAETEKADTAKEAFTEAKAAETAHASLYQEALDNLDGWKAGKKDFFVCPECGNTVIALTFANCPVCGQPKDKFKKIN